MPYPIPRGCFNPSAACCSSLVRAHTYDWLSQVRRTLFKSGVVVFKVSMFAIRRQITHQRRVPNIPPPSFKTPARHIRSANVLKSDLNNDSSYVGFGSLLRLKNERFLLCFNGFAVSSVDPSGETLADLRFGPSPSFSMSLSSSSTSLGESRKLCLRCRGRLLGGHRA